MFSKELYEMDRNTVRYMIDEMQNQIDQQKEEIDQQKVEIHQQREAINRQKEELDQKDLALETALNRIKELEKSVQRTEGE